MTIIPEGYALDTLPETQALLKLMGADDAPRREGMVGLRICLMEREAYTYVYLPEGDSISRLTCRVERIDSSVKGLDLYHRAEFKAFCARLGIAWELPTKWLTVDLKEGEAPTVTQVYLLSEPESKPLIALASIE